MAEFLSWLFTVILKTYYSLNERMIQQQWQARQNLTFHSCESVGKFPSRYLPPIYTRGRKSMQALMWSLRYLCLILIKIGMCWNVLEKLPTSTFVNICHSLLTCSLRTDRCARLNWNSQNDLTTESDKNRPLHPKAIREAEGHTHTHTTSL